MTTFAIRSRPYVDPYPIASIKADALAARETRFANRKAAIKSLIAEAAPDDRDEFHWTLVYDLEQAPTMTSRALLLEAGIIPVPPQELATDADVHDELWTILEALSTVGVLLMNTDHLCDRDLYSRLYFRILDEECRALPPSCEACEYIDCLHPMDQSHPLGALLLARCAAGAPNFCAPVQRGPICLRSTGLVDRDRYLPGPRQ